MTSLQPKQDTKRKKSLSGWMSKHQQDTNIYTAIIISHLYQKAKSYTKQVKLEKEMKRMKHESVLRIV